MTNSQRTALERLIRVAQSDTGQSRIVANFLLAWWNAAECGGFDLTDVWAAPVWPLEPRLPKGLPAHFERNAASNACTYMA